MADSALARSAGDITSGLSSERELQSLEYSVSSAGELARKAYFSKKEARK